MTEEKPKDMDFTVTFEEEERVTLTGSACRIKVNMVNIVLEDSRTKNETNRFVQEKLW
jgi:hypothetical protein